MLVSLASSLWSRGNPRILAELNKRLEDLWESLLKKPVHLDIKILSLSSKLKRLFLRGCLEVLAGERSYLYTLGD